MARALLAQGFDERASDPSLTGARTSSACSVPRLLPAQRSALAIRVDEHEDHATIAELEVDQIAGQTVVELLWPADQGGDIERGVGPQRIAADLAAIAAEFVDQ